MSNDRIAEVQDIVRKAAKVHALGAGTKTAFHPDVEGVINIPTDGLQGVVSYDPQEFVITVLSGTRVSEVIGVLAERGQYLPFDPLLNQSHATIGGTVASNAAGPCRFRFGGIRDFLIGVRFIDGRGNCIRGGGQVVKNAAGFDYPKLMVGSQGKLGWIYELTFKVFPRPESFATMIGKFSELDQAFDCMNRIASSAMDAEAIDLIPSLDVPKGYELAVRIGGIADALPNRLNRLQACMEPSQILTGDQDALYWLNASNFTWAMGESLLKMPIAPRAIPDWEKALSKAGSPRRYSVGGNVVWIAGTMPDAGTIPLGAAQTFLGKACSNGVPSEPGPFGLAIKRALDPDMKWV